MSIEEFVLVYKLRLLLKMRRKINVTNPTILPPALLWAGYDNNLVLNYDLYQC